MTDRGKFKVIRDPAVAIAAGKCWIARWGSRKILGGLPVDSFHPEDCAFCDLDPTYLIEAIDEFMNWSGLRDGDDAELERPVEAFLQLNAEAQASVVREAQGYI